MKKELFIKHITNCGVGIIPRDDPNFNPCILEEFRRLKGFIQNINFNCQINKNGGCKEHPSTIRCCCDSCYNNSGFFRTMIDKDMGRYTRSFLKTGFWRKGKGCVLPHELRSVVCLTHHCNCGDGMNESVVYNDTN